MLVFKNTFKKAEKLCNKIFIEQLYSDSSTIKIYNYPLILAWKEVELKTEYPAQILISVKKKFSKRAVDRNRIKRQLREIYRLNKDVIYKKLFATNKKIAISLIYIGNEKLPYSKIENSFEKILSKFIKAL
ncbi:MAG: ribonuclease P protein component [Bacteroidota bacterium]|nr:ribonuclease P protein component [Bacteroidota bacterium]